MTRISEEKLGEILAALGEWDTGLGTMSDTDARSALTELRGLREALRERQETMTASPCGTAPKQTRTGCTPTERSPGTTAARSSVG
jgi:hypothetical protein